MQAQTTIDLFGVTLDVTGNYTPYSPGSAFEPATQPDFDIASVILNGVDVTELLSNLYTGKGDPALDVLASELAHEGERHQMARNPRAMAYVPPFAGCGA